jgi:hypothetical protein
MLYSFEKCKNTIRINITKKEDGSPIAIGRRAEDRRQKTEDRRVRTEDGGLRAEAGGQTEEDRRRRAEE